MLSCSNLATSKQEMIVSTIQAKFALLAIPVYLTNVIINLFVFPPLSLIASDIVFVLWPCRDKLSSCAILKLLTLKVLYTAILQLY